MAWQLFVTRFCDVTSSVCDLLQYTCTEKCNLFVLYNKNSKDLLKDFGGMKKKNNFPSTRLLVEEWRYSRWYSTTYVCILLLLFVIATKALQATGKHLIFDLGIYPINEWFSVIQLFLDVFFNLICSCNLIVACLFLLFLSNALMNYAI